MPRHVPVAHHSHPVALDHRLQDVGIDGHSAHRLDLRPRDRLPVGDERKSFQQCTRVLRGPFRPQPGDFVRQLPAHLDAKPRGRFLNLDAALGVVVRQRRERSANLLQRRAAAVLEKLRQLRRVQGLTGREQGRFDDVFDR